MVCEHECTVMIDSIGTASLRNAVAVAHGLRLAVDEAVRAIYRAPAVLTVAPTRAVADKLCTFLRDLGFEASVGEAVAAPAGLRPIELLDVALHLRDPLKTFDAAAAIAEFCGIGEAAALKLVTEPPSIVLGGVSRATVDALAHRLEGLDAELIASNPETAHFDLFAAGLPATVHARLCRELIAAGQAVPEAAGVVATGLPHGFADALWRKYGRTGAVRMVDRAFLRFDLVLDGLSPGFAASAEQAETLDTLFGVPAEMLGTLIAEAPVTLACDLRYGEFEPLLAQLAEVGLAARATLSTFQSVALEIASARDTEAVGAEMAALGMLDERVTLPCTTMAMPVSMARMVRARLEAAGAEVWTAGAAA
ncbi:MAG: hypothetical protein V4574_09185 [Pseudomonadota bacterium]